MSKKKVLEALSNANKGNAYLGQRLSENVERMAVAEISKDEAEKFKEKSQKDAAGLVDQIGREQTIRGDKLDGEGFASEGEEYFNRFNQSDLEGPAETILEELDRLMDKAEEEDIEIFEELKEDLKERYTTSRLISNKYEDTLEKYDQGQITTGEFFDQMEEYKGSTDKELGKEIGKALMRSLDAGEYKRLLDKAFIDEENGYTEEQMEVLGGIRNLYKIGEELGVYNLDSDIESFEGQKNWISYGIGSRSGKRWTEGEEEFLKKNYEDKSVEDLATLMGRTVGAVEARYGSME